MPNRGTGSTAIGAISLTQLHATFVFEGATDEHAFMTFVTDGVDPHPAARSDRGHGQSPEFTQASGPRGTSAWPNPIEEGWSRVKAILRRVAIKRHRQGSQRCHPARPQGLVHSRGLPHGNRCRDPFDRILVAQAIAENLKLLTTDGALVPYGRCIVQV